MKNYTLVLDCWEGSLEINENELQKGGVGGLIPRLNDINGGHHKDAGFDKQWAEAESFVRAPYFVYNPWKTGRENYDWLAHNMPANCPVAHPDIEVKKLDYSPDIYAFEVSDFMSRVRANWISWPYTGNWVLPLLSYWPSGDYWWQYYPFYMYPDEAQTIGWDALSTRLAGLDWPPTNYQKCPGQVRLWQCSGDRYILPGTLRTMDLNVFPGTVSDLRVAWGYDTAPVPPTPTLEQMALDLLKLKEQARLHGWDV